MAKIIQETSPFQYSLTMTPKELQSRTITILRFPLAFMVVAIHASYFKLQNINIIGGVFCETVLTGISRLCPGI